MLKNRLLNSAASLIMLIGFAGLNLRCALAGEKDSKGNPVGFLSNESKKKVDEAAALGKTLSISGNPYVDLVGLSICALAGGVHLIDKATATFKKKKAENVGGS